MSNSDSQSLQYILINIYRCSFISNIRVINRFLLNLVIFRSPIDIFIP